MYIPLSTASVYTTSMQPKFFIYTFILLIYIVYRLLLYEWMRSHRLRTVHMYISGFTPYVHINYQEY